MNNALAATAQNAAPASSQAETAFRALADQYFDEAVFKFSPTNGTLVGFHQYDSLLEDYSRAGVDAQITALHTFDKKFAAISNDGLDQVAQDDLTLVRNNIKASLLGLEVIRQWEKNPDNYSGGITNSAFSLMERKFASPDERLKSLVAREKLMPAVFTDARKNLKNPPHIYTEIAIAQMPGVIRFFQNDVPLAFKDATDATTKAAFAKSNADVIAALQSYQDWLKNDLLAKSNGDFRIGAKTFQEKLKYDEMVDTPLDQLLEIGYADLHKNQADFNRIAKEVSSTKSATEVLDDLGNDHPAPTQLLQSFRDTFDGLIAFIQEKQIITIPSDIRPILEETPPFMRATTMASMDTPGPFEKVAHEAYFNVTLPEKDWTSQHVSEFMHSFNVGTIVSTSIHEAYPGHYIQFLWVPEAPSKVRKLLGAATNAEGWAHYCEQMMLDAGYGQPGTGAKSERESQLLRLGQLQDALLRDARFIVGIKMHTGKMTYDEGVDFFVKEGYQSRESSIVEAKRGTSDPTYLYYTLGKLEILKLRADVQKQQGDSFTLRKFHDDFMRQGFPPIAIVRKAMLGNSSPTL